MHKSEGEKFDFAAYHKQCISEQREVERYVLTKELARPKTNALTIVLMVFSYICVCSAATLTIIFIPQLPKTIRALGAVFIWIASFAFCIKNFLIKLVECYQHYAKEETRRRCLCMPTCSEYAIMVLKEYCTVKALYKIHKRLFKTCKDGIYKKDFPKKKLLNNGQNNKSE